MQNITPALTLTEFILATMGIIIISYSCGIILFEMARNKQKPGDAHFQRGHYAKKVFRIGLSISFSLIALNMIMDAISIYYQLPLFWVLCFAFFTIMGFVFSIVLWAYIAWK